MTILPLAIRFSVPAPALPVMLAPVSEKVSAAVPATVTRDVAVDDKKTLLPDAAALAVMAPALVWNRLALLPTLPAVARSVRDAASA